MQSRILLQREPRAQHRCTRARRRRAAAAAAAAAAARAAVLASIQGTTQGRCWRWRRHSGTPSRCALMTAQHRVQWRRTCTSALWPAAHTVRCAQREQVEAFIADTRQFMRVFYVIVLGAHAAPLASPHPPRRLGGATPWDSLTCRRSDARTSHTLRGALSRHAGPYRHALYSSWTKFTWRLARYVNWTAHTVEAVRRNAQGAHTAILQRAVLPVVQRVPLLQSLLRSPQLLDLLLLYGYSVTLTLAFVAAVAGCRRLSRLVSDSLPPLAPPVDAAGRPSDPAPAGAPAGQRGSRGAVQLPQ